MEQFTPRLLESDEIQNEPRASRVLHRDDRGFQLVLFKDAKLELGRRLIAEHMATTDACSDEIGERYMIDLLQDDVTKPANIFVMLTGVSPNSNRLVLGNRIPIGFVVCKVDRRHGVTIELALICAARVENLEDGIKLGLGSVMMYHVLRYYNMLMQNVRLYATAENLVFYYARFGFVLVPLNAKCPLPAAYVAEWDRIVAALANDPMRKNLDESALAIYYQNGLFNALEPGSTRNYFFWSVLDPPTGQQAAIGFYMIFCQELADTRLPMAARSAAKGMSLEAIELFEREYVFELDMVKKERYMNEI